MKVSKKDFPLISLNDLDEKPCDKYYDIIVERYDEGLFNPINLIQEMSNDFIKDVSWLIIHCEKYQTSEMLDYYKSLNPSYDNVSWLIINCEKYQIPEMIEYYKSLNPSYNNVSWLIKDCEKYQTPEMIEYYKSLNPNDEDVSLLIKSCEYCQTLEMLEYYKSLKPSYSNVFKKNNVMEFPLISLNDLDRTPCDEYYNTIVERYGEGLFNPINLIREMTTNIIEDVTWLIAHCKKYQTLEMLEYYKSLNPYHSNISWLIKRCEYFQTPEMLEHYKSLIPYYEKIDWDKPL